MIKEEKRAECERIFSEMRTLGIETMEDLAKPEPDRGWWDWLLKRIGWRETRSMQLYRLLCALHEIPQSAEHP